MRFQIDGGKRLQRFLKMNFIFTYPFFSAPMQCVEIQANKILREKKTFSVIHAQMIDDFPKDSQLIQPNAWNCSSTMRIMST